MTYSKIDVFHGKDLEETVNKAIISCPNGYDVEDLKVNFINNEWIVVSKIEQNNTGEIKVKIFEGIVLPTQHQQIRFGFIALDKQINEWLKDNNDISIKRIKQSSASYGDQEDFSSRTTISIWYE